MDILILLSLCLLSWREVWGQHDHETKEEKVKHGERVALPCEALSIDNSRNTTVQWLYDNKGNREIYPRGSKEFREESELKRRVSLEKSSTLVIDDMQVRDEKLYICHVEDQNGIPKESRIQLRVYKTPGEPEIKMKDNGIPVTDNAVEIGTCESKNGFPTPNITWYNNNLPLRNGQDAVEIDFQVTVESSGLITVKSILSAPVHKSDVAAVFYCEVSYYLPKGIHMMESEKKNITVYYPNTKVSLVLNNESGKVIEGDTVELVCEGDGNPQPEITLYKKDSDTVLSNEPTYSWRVSRADSGGYVCKAFDIENASDMVAETEIHVHFLDPPVLSEESPVIVMLGSTLSVSCQANASIQTEIQWTRVSDHLAQRPSVTLTIPVSSLTKGTRPVDGITTAKGSFLNTSSVDYTKGGRYLCVVDLPGVPGLTDSTDLQVIVKGKPQVVVSQQYVEVRDGENVTVTCKATGYPQPQITWYINGSEVNAHIAVSNVSDYEMISEMILLVTQDLINERLTCNAYNEFNNSVEYILLQERPETTAIFVTNSESKTTVAPIPNTDSRSEKSYGVVIVAVIVCILLLAILGAVLYFLYKKGRIPCGRSGKQDITKLGDKDKIVVEMKPDSPAEESVLLPGPQEKKQSGDQEKYMDLRN